MKHTSWLLAVAACGNGAHAVSDSAPAPDVAADASGVDLSADLAPIAAQYGMPALAALVR